MKIGVFDSGFGGLDILREVTKALPDYDYIYLGDTARTPYGTRSQEVVYQYTRDAVDYLFKADCQLVILACNTASAEALPKIQQKYLPENYPDRRVLGVIIPACESAVDVTSADENPVQNQSRKISVMATESSVESGAFVREIQKLNPDIVVTQQACPLLVPLVENNETDAEIVEPILKKYLQPLVAGENAGETGTASAPDAIILGCTHYGFLEPQIKKVLVQLNHPEIKIINEATVVADKLADYLKRHSEIETKLSKNGDRVFCSTDLTERFKTIGSQFYGAPITVTKIEL